MTQRRCPRCGVFYTKAVGACPKCGNQAAFNKALHTAKVNNHLHQQAAVA